MARWPHENDETTTTRENHKDDDDRRELAARGVTRAEKLVALERRAAGRLKDGEPERGSTRGHKPRSRALNSESFLDLLEGNANV